MGLVWKYYNSKHNGVEVFGLEVGDFLIDEVWINCGFGLCKVVKESHPMATEHV